MFVLLCLANQECKVLKHSCSLFLSEHVRFVGDFCTGDQVGLASIVIVI